MGIVRVSSPGSFRMLVGSQPYGYDFTLPGSVKPAYRQTVTTGPIHTEGGKTANAKLVADPITGLVFNEVGRFTVADNDFSTGWTEICIGDYRLINGFDYIVGVGVNATAAAIAAAINLNYAPFTAESALAVVTVTYNGGPADKVEFRAVHRGTKVNFTPFVPTTDYLTAGSPTIGPPVLG